MILGAGGLVGNQLAEAAQRLNNFRVPGTAEPAVPLKRIVLADLQDCSGRLCPALLQDPRVLVRTGDLCDEAFLAEVLASEGCAHVSVLHIAALLSGNAEDNFDLGMQVNLQGPIKVMERVRRLSAELGRPQVYLFASTDYVACFNEANRTTPVHEESFRLSPVSYGVQKACVELLVCDYTRKGFLDGRVARLSAVIGRPGFSNSISYPFTGIFTQPLEGKDYDCPLPMDTPLPCSSLRNNVAGILYLAGQADLSSMDGAHGCNRVVQLPAKSWTLNDLWEATQEVAKEEGVRLGAMKCVPPKDGQTTVKEINVCPAVDCSKAEKLGLPMNVDAKDIIRNYLRTYVLKS